MAEPWCPHPRYGSNTVCFVGVTGGRKMRKQVKCYKILVAMIIGLFGIQVSIYGGGLGAVPKAARIFPC